MKSRKAAVGIVFAGAAVLTGGAYCFANKIFQENMCRKTEKGVAQWEQYIREKEAELEKAEQEKTEQEKAATEQKYANDGSDRHSEEDVRRMDRLKREAFAWLKTQQIENWTEWTEDKKTKLSATYIKAAQPSKKTVLLSHGYGADGLSDMCIFLPFYGSLGWNILVVDHRAFGMSEGDYVGFGVLEGRDIRTWCQRIIRENGEDSEILLHGWSMGAASVMLAATDVPRQVKGLVFDCGYESAMEEFIHVGKQTLHLPKVVSVPILQISSRICKRKAGYTYQEASPLKAAGQVTLPVLFVHGKKDDFVPFRFGEHVEEAAASTYKDTLYVDGAEHVMSYLYAKEEYEQAIRRLIAHFEQEEEEYNYYEW